jgi:hypothetical protein
MKSILAQIPGVIPRLISARQDAATGRYIMIVGGGDPYYVAYAIWRAMFWPGGLLYAPIYITYISSTNPAVVTTSNNHNLINGMIETITGVQGLGGMPSINGKPFPVTVIDNKNFSIPFNATLPGFSYSIGGIVSPNPIVEEVTIVDYPDTYLLPYVLPAQEVVTIAVTWQTDSPNYIASSAVAAVAAPAIQEYINSLPVGLTPINFYDMTATFLDSVSGILPAEAVTVLNFAVGIDGVGVEPSPGTGVVYGDPNSYFYIELSGIVVIERTV